MSRCTGLLAAIVSVCLVLTVPAVADDRAAERVPGDLGALVDAAIDDIVDDRIAKARRVVRDNTGVDLSRRGYEGGEHAGDLPQDASGKVGRDLARLSQEHDQKLRKLGSDLEEKLREARDESERHEQTEKDAEKLRSKRAKLQAKIDKAYAKFDQRVTEENRRFDRKRGQIIAKSSKDAGSSKNRDAADAKRAARDRDDDERAVDRRAKQPESPTASKDARKGKTAVEEKSWWRFWD
ncbi:MAG: hypothetical protein ACU85V_16510 [Gammaproteobacteria bacterium]